MTIHELNARFFALCRQHRIQPPLGEDGEPTGEGWLDEAPEAGKERAA